MRPRLGFVLRLAVGIAVLTLVLSTVDVATLWRRGAAADLRLVVAALIGLVAVHAVAGLGWRSLVEATSGIRLGAVEALRLHYSGQAIGGMTPGNLGGDVYRAAALRSAGHGWTGSVAPIIVQRATSYLALSALSLIALAALASTRAAASLTVVGLAFAGAVAVAAWFLLAPPRRLLPVAGPVHRWLGGSAVVEKAAVPRPVLRSSAAMGFANGLLFHAISVLLLWGLVIGVDDSAASLTILAALTVARLSLAVPISPSGLGIQEGAATALVAALGGPVESVLAGILIARLALVATTVVGLALAMAPRLAYRAGEAHQPR